MKNNKGFGAIALLLILAGVLIVGGGAYYLGKSSSTNILPNNNVLPENNVLQDNQGNVPQNTEDTSKVVNPNPDSNATVCLPTTAPWINVSSPVAGATYTTGQQVNVQWTSCNVQNVYLGLMSGGKDFGLFSETPILASVGSYQWTAINPGKQFTNLSTNSYQIGIESQTPNVLVKSGVFTVTTTAVNNNSGSKVVNPNPDSNATVCLPTTAPWIKVLTPNGGEIYQIGQTTVFKWTSCNVGNVTGELTGISNPDNSKSLFGESSGGATNNGQFSINFGPNVNGIQWINPGTYKFKVYKFSTPSLNDSSDNLFTINAKSTTPTQKTQASIDTFTLTNSEFVVTGKYLSKIQIWYIPTGTGITTNDYQKVIDTTAYQGTPAMQAFYPLKVCPPPSAGSIFTRGFDQQGNQLATDKFLSYQGASDIWDNVFQSYCH